MLQHSSSRLFKWSTIFIILLFLSVTQTFSQSPVPEGASAELLENGFQLAEGPYWHPNGYLLFSDVWSGIIYKWSEDSGLTSYLNPSGEANGISADLEGNILICQHSARQVARIESDGSVTPLATHYDGKRLHSPNDLAVKSDGAIFFTDPPWGGNPSEMDFHGVYRIPPNGGSVQLVVDNLSYPNGIAFSPDESKLYLSHYSANTILVYDVVDDSILANGTIFATLPGESGGDGMKVDASGNLYATCSAGVAIFSPQGVLLDTIEVSRSTNVNFGSENGQTLFITTFPAVYKIDLIDPTVSIGDDWDQNQIEYQLKQNYPNPFNPFTKINYQLKYAGHVVNQEQSAGNYSINFDGSHLASGIYIYRLKAGSLVQSRKMLLIK